MKMSVIWLLICLTFGCQTTPSSLEQWMASGGKLKVLSTTGIIDDLVGQIGGDKIDHISLIASEADPHSYELVKGDDEKFLRADLIVYNGLGLEHGASLAYQIKKHKNRVAIGDFIRSQSPQAVIYEKGEIDPHIWLDVSLWKEAVEPIATALCHTDPENASYYTAQAGRVKADLEALDLAILTKMRQVASEKRYLVTSHDAFNYFARRYLAEGKDCWKDRFCAPEGLAPDGQMGCQDIEKVVDYLKNHEVRVLFPEANISKDSLRKIAAVCKEMRFEIKLSSSSLYSDSLGPRTYKEMMEHNMGTLWSAWMQ
jgi:manganese/zinc/iron transport system substrate-binding protein